MSLMFLAMTVWSPRGPNRRPRPGPSTTTTFGVFRARWRRPDAAIAVTGRCDPPWVPRPSDGGRTALVDRTQRFIKQHPVLDLIVSTGTVGSRQDVVEALMQHVRRHRPGR